VPDGRAAIEVVYAVAVRRMELHGAYPQSPVDPPSISAV
jgi:hypothetical protein